MGAITHQQVIDDLIAQYEKFLRVTFSDEERKRFTEHRLEVIKHSRILGSLPPALGQLCISGPRARSILNQKLVKEKDEVKIAEIKRRLEQIEGMESRSTSPQGIAVSVAWTEIE
jgi:hypothetical protein